MVVALALENDMTKLVNQPTARPARKVQAAGISAVVSVPLASIAADVVVNEVIVERVPYLMEQQGNIELLILALLSACGVFGAAYMTRERA